MLSQKTGHTEIFFFFLHHVQSKQEARQQGGSRSVQTLLRCTNRQQSSWELISAHLGCFTGDSHHEHRENNQKSFMSRVYSRRGEGGDKRRLAAASGAGPAPGAWSRSCAEFFIQMSNDNAKAAANCRSGFLLFFPGQERFLANISYFAAQEKIITVEQCQRLERSQAMMPLLVQVH